MTTLSLIVTAEDDDADETGGGTVNETNALVRLLTSAYWAGLRFTGVTIPAGSTINTATLTVYVDSTANDDPGGLLIYGEKTINPAVFTTAASSISSRTKTTAFATWTGTAVGVGDEVSPSLVTVWQEIINQGSWASGQAAVLLLDAGASTAFRFNGYGTSTTTCARVDLDYTAPAAASSFLFPRRQRVYTRM